MNAHRTASIREVIREEPVMRARILDAARRPGPRTVPEIAAAIGAPDPRGRLLGHGHAPLRLARARSRASPVDGYFRYERDRDGMTAAR